MVHTAVSLIVRFRDAGLAGEVPDAGDLAILAACFDDVLATGKPVQDAMRLPPRWFESYRAAEIDRLLTALAPASIGATKAALERRKALAVYARHRFAVDRHHGRAQRVEDEGKYRLMMLFDEVLPTADALLSREKRSRS